MVEDWLCVATAKYCVSNVERPERCPEGRKPGASCLEGREGFLCALCSDGKVPADDGTCKDFAHAGTQIGILRY
eukprot:1800255-Amphidinium_carterae.1